MEKLLGLDLGEVSLGIAISDALGMMAHGLETFTFKRDHYKHALERVVEIADKERIKTVVLGFPKNMNNTEGERAEVSRRFARRLEEAGLTVVLWDERLSTLAASRVLIDGGVRRENRKKHVDKLAAQLILQNYLDSSSGSNSSSN